MRPLAGRCTCIGAMYTRTILSQSGGQQQSVSRLYVLDQPDFTSLDLFVVSAWCLESSWPRIWQVLLPWDTSNNNSSAWVNVGYRPSGCISWLGHIIHIYILFFTYIFLTVAADHSRGWNIFFFLNFMTPAQAVVLYHIGRDRRRNLMLVFSPDDLMVSSWLPKYFLLIYKIYYWIPILILHATLLSDSSTDLVSRLLLVWRWSIATLILYIHDSMNK